MKIKTIFTGALLLLGINKAQAVSCPSVHNFCEVYGTEISAVYINSTGKALIGLPSVDGWLTLGDINNDTVKTMYSTALAIKASSYKGAWVRWVKESRNVTIVSYDYK